MHVISKLAPNWTWATFEHKDNPGRCDVIGCKDAFGAQQAFVPPNSAVESKQHYPDCVKTTELAALFAHANLDPAYANYCLKGSQSDFTDATGLAIRLGNSVTEKSFVDQASCITCHGRAAVDETGKMTSFAGFGPISINLPLTQNAGNAPVGPIDPNWFWVPWRRRHRSRFWPTKRTFRGSRWPSISSGQLRSARSTTPPTRRRRHRGSAQTNELHRGRAAATGGPFVGDIQASPSQATRSFIVRPTA